MDEWMDWGDWKNKNKIGARNTSTLSVLSHQEVCCHKTDSEQWHCSLQRWLWASLGSGWLKGMIPESVTHNCFLPWVHIAKARITSTPFPCIFLLFCLFLSLGIQCSCWICARSQKQGPTLAEHLQALLAPDSSVVTSLGTVLLVQTEIRTVQERS